jgi:hypothetical protein
MRERTPIALAYTPTRRQMMTGLVIACCSQVMNPSLWGQDQVNAMRKVPSSVGRGDFNSADCLL